MNPDLSMEIDYGPIIEKVKKEAVLSMIAKIDRSGEMTAFVKALLDNGCTADAIIDAIVSIPSKEESKKEETN